MCLIVRCGSFGCLVVVVLLLWVGRGLSGWVGVLLGVCLCWDGLWRSCLVLYVLLFCVCGVSGG